MRVSDILRNLAPDQTLVAVDKIQEILSENGLALVPVWYRGEYVLSRTGGEDLVPDDLEPWKIYGYLDEGQGIYQNGDELAILNGQDTIPDGWAFVEPRNLRDVFEGSKYGIYRRLKKSANYFTVVDRETAINPCLVTDGRFSGSMFVREGIVRINWSVDIDEILELGDSVVFYPRISSESGMKNDVESLILKGLGFEPVTVAVPAEYRTATLPIPSWARAKLGTSPSTMPVAEAREAAQDYIMSLLGQGFSPELERLVQLALMGLNSGETVSEEDEQLVQKYLNK